MLVLPKRVPLKALKGFEGCMVTESVSYLRGLYLPLCQCLKRKKKYPIYLHLWKLEKGCLLSFSNPILSNLCSINVYNLLSDSVYNFTFFSPFWLDNFIWTGYNTQHSIRSSHLRVNVLFWKRDVKMMNITWEEDWTRAKELASCLVEIAFDFIKRWGNMSDYIMYN